MDISQITPPAVRGSALVSPLAPARTVALEQAKDLSFLGVAPTTVDLSSSGRFLSLVSLFQKKALDLQSSVLADADAATPAALADAAVAAAAVAGAFNQMQTSAVDSNGLPTDTLDGQSLQSQFFQQLGNTPEEAEASLAAIGLRFTPADNGAASELSVDDGVLQDAFRQDPAATAALLQRSADAFLGVASTRIQGQVANLSPLDDDSAFAAALPVADFIAQQADVAPDSAAGRQASYADNVFRQSLVTENARDDEVAPAGDAIAPAPPTALPDAGDVDDVSVPASLTGAPPSEPLFDGARVVAALGQADTPALDAEATLADARLNALLLAPVYTAAPAAAAPAATVTAAAPTPAAATAAPALQAAITPPETGLQPPAPATPAPAGIVQQDTIESAANSVEASVVQQARILAQQFEAEREAAQALDQKIASASGAVRAALADDIARRDASRVEQRELDKGLLQQGEDRLEQAGAIPATPDAPLRPAAAVATAAALQSASAPADTVQVQSAQPAAVPLPDQARQAARDPAIAAAIAAYHVNTGPFAAQNGRPDIAPPKARPVPPVAAVTKVEPAGAIGTPGGGSAPLR